MECLRRIERSEVAGFRKQVLVHWVETYVELSEQDAAEFQRLLDLEENKGVREMELTWLEKAELNGFEKGWELAGREAVDRMRKAVLNLVEQRFGAVPKRLETRLEAVASMDVMADLVERILVVHSIDELLVS